MRILGINALFHDPAAALVIDGRTVAAAEEERFSRRKHGKRPLPFSAWELPERAAAWCLARAGLRPQDLDAVTYSFDPRLARPAEDMGLDDPWDHLRLTYAREAPGFLTTALPGLDPAASASCRTTWPTPPPAPSPHRMPGTPPSSSSTAVANAPPTWPRAAWATAWRRCTRRTCRTPSVWSTRTSPSTSASFAPLTAHRAARGRQHQPQHRRRAMADDPRDALECFGFSPVDLLAIGPYAIRRGDLFRPDPRSDDAGGPR